MNIWDKIAEGVRKTRDSMRSRLMSLFGAFTKIDENFFEELEETLIMCDIGVETSVEICAELRKKVKEQGITDPQLIMGLLQEIITGMLGEDRGLDLSAKPAVILVIGVNGAGKTTTIGKLAARLVSEGKNVIVAAADTFRAAAIDQLQIWVDRAGAQIVKQSEGSDPAAVVFDAITAAKARGADVVICDTAGRLHNKKNLMEELKKITRICRQQAEDCSIETLLVLDATTGQNAVNQAKLFSEAADITGIVLTKLDGTAKGGIIITIHKELGLPVKLVGVGEKIDDLMDFSAADYAAALFEDNVDFEGNYERITEGDESGSEEISGEENAEEISGNEENPEGGNDKEISANEEYSDSENVRESSENEDNSENENVGEISENENADGNSENDDESEAVGETEEDEETSEGENEDEGTEENSDNVNEKKSLKDGKFGFLFKEISFGKKSKKDGETED
ncbi:MAG: signal recognition particle-docking protein FtsY [Oscillospiraceae bacterium]|nr:signal recognition particle-docking protein FtsY [Oscillospiraceae bacterium]